jgi:hypothetical protein
LKRITLSPPIARRLAPVAWTAALLLEQLALFNTHYLGIIRRRGDAVAPSVTPGDVDVTARRDGRPDQSVELEAARADVDRANRPSDRRI